MSTDRELLEAAAKAAGYDVRWHEAWACHVHCGPHNITQPPTMAGQRDVWVPLYDDGDALRLAVKLNLLHTYDMDQVAAMCDFDATDPDPYAATRRAIVRAAAALAAAPGIGAA